MLLFVIGIAKRGIQESKCILLLSSSRSAFCLLRAQSFICFRIFFRLILVQERELVLHSQLLLLDGELRLEDGA